jgi:hypothetical protein
MVDALRRARRFLSPAGWIVDIHPTAASRLEVGSTIIGPVETGDAPQRHRTATAAVESIVAEGALRSDRHADFDFYTYGDSVEELAAYVEEEWNDARIDADTIARARAVLLSAPGAKPRILERVRLTVLRPAPPVRVTAAAQ